MKRIFILTGEPSGDKLASTVVKRLKLSMEYKGPTPPVVLILISPSIDL